MTKAQSGKLGGLATLKKYGNQHMANIGKRGAQAFWKKYTLKPVNLSHFAIVNRQTNEIIAHISKSW